MGALHKNFGEAFICVPCFAKLRALLLKDRPPSKFREDTSNLRALLCYLRILLAWFKLEEIPSSIQVEHVFSGGLS